MTLQDVKDHNALSGPIKGTLDKFCDLWYAIAIRDGNSEEVAIRIALDKLGSTMLDMSKKTYYYLITVFDNGEVKQYEESVKVGSSNVADIKAAFTEILNKKYKEWKFEWYLGDQNTFKRS